MEKNQEFIVTIEDMNEDGAGVGKLDGYIWFVKDAVIGQHLNKLRYPASVFLTVCTHNRTTIPNSYPIAPQKAYCIDGLH